MELIIGILVFACFVALVAGEIFFISAVLKRIVRFHFLLKAVVAIVTFFVINVPYIYVAQFRPEGADPVLLIGMIEACCLAFYGFFRIFRDYYSAFKRKQLERHV